MNKKECKGCGSVLQTDYPGQEGFVKSSVYDKSEYCERCFKIIHYNERIVTNLDNINSYIGAILLFGSAFLSSWLLSILFSLC